MGLYNYRKQKPCSAKCQTKIQGFIFSVFFAWTVSIMESLLSALPTPFLSSPSTFFSDQPVPEPRPIFPLLHRAKPRFEPLLCTMSQSFETETKSKEAKLWGGRFEESVTEIVEKFTESISFDKQLYKHDIMGSKAHASMLAKQVATFSFSFLSSNYCL